MTATPTDNPLEMLPVVTEQGEVTGSATRRECHDGSRLLHPVVHLHVFNPRGELYLQRRPLWKTIQPGRWDTAVGGHVAAGENPNDALLREASEEIGLSGFQAQFVNKYVWESDVERELVYVFTTVVHGPLTPSAETDGGRFWSLDEIRENIGRPHSPFTPNFEHEFRRFFWVP